MSPGASCTSAAALLAAAIALFTDGRRAWGEEKGGAQHSRVTHGEILGLLCAHTAAEGVPAMGGDQLHKSRRANPEGTS